MTAAMVPALTKVIDWVAQGVEWMGRNPQTATAFFGAIAAVIAAVPASHAIGCCGYPGGYVAGQLPSAHRGEVGAFCAAV